MRFNITSENVWSAFKGHFPAVLSLLLFGCGGASTNNSQPQPPKNPQPSTEFLYSTNLKGIMAFPLNPSNGALGSGIQAASDLASIGFLADMVSDPGGKFLFVCSLGNSSIEAFSINTSTGALTQVSGSPFPVQGGGAGNLSIDPSGRFLYAAGASGMTAYRINETTGALSAIAGSPFSDGSALLASVVDPAGRFLYASGNTTQVTTSVFTIDSNNGALTAIPGSPFVSPINDEVFGLAVHPSGKFLYGIFPTVNSIIAWSISPSTGALTLMPASPFATGNGASNLLIGPNGNFLYTLNGSDSTVSAFSIDVNSGSLTAVGGAPFPVNAGTGYLAIDPSGEFMYSSDGSIKFNTLTGFNINASSGAITAFSSAPVATVDPFLLAVVRTSK